MERERKAQSSKLKVVVLMSTYNGERFLREQMDSIFSQEGVEVYLMVRDDGSEDGTCGILAEYAGKYGNMEWEQGENVGFVKSFTALMKKAYESALRPDWYALADQDDVWMPRKLQRACEELEQSGRITNPSGQIANPSGQRPMLFTSNSMQVDADGKEMGLFHKGPEPRFRKGNVLVFGTEQGCSMVFNRRAVELYAQHEPRLTWHDRWLYHICYFLGSVTYCHEPLFYYRRHEHNALANRVAGSLEGVRCRMVRAYRILWKEPPVTNHVEMAQEFYRVFGAELSEEDRRIFQRFVVCRTSIVSKIYMLLSPHFIYPYYDANEGRLLKWLILAGRV